MKRLLAISLLLLLTALSLSSCQQTEAVSVPLDKLNTCPPEYKDKVVSVEAYLGADRDDGSLFCHQRCFLEVSPEPNSGSGKLRAEVELGKGANQMEVSPEFMHDEPVWRPERIPNDEHMRRLYESLQIRTNDNKLLRIKDRVKLTGKLETYQGLDSCHLRVERIEQQ